MKTTHKRGRTALVCFLALGIGVTVLVLAGCNIGDSGSGSSLPRVDDVTLPGSRATVNDFAEFSDGQDGFDNVFMITTKSDFDALLESGDTDGLSALSVAIRPAEESNDDWLLELLDKHLSVTYPTDDSMRIRGGFTDEVIDLAAEHPEDFASGKAQASLDIDLFLESIYDASRDRGSMNLDLKSGLTVRITDPLTSKYPDEDEMQFLGGYFTGAANAKIDLTENYANGTVSLRYAVAVKLDTAVSAVAVAPDTSGPWADNDYVGMHMIVTVDYADRLSVDSSFDNFASDLASKIDNDAFEVTVKLHNAGMSQTASFTLSPDQFDAAGFSPAALVPSSRR